MKHTLTASIRAAIIGLFMVVLGKPLVGQQEPQYTHYQYNTMAVNPAYTGSLGNLAVTGLYRTQWVGLEGAPRTISLGIDAPFRQFNGLGISIVRDDIGPASETYVDANYAHSIVLNSKGDRLAFGLKVGGQFLNIDWSKGLLRDPDSSFNESIKGEFLFRLGAGLFYYSDKSYAGISIPNVLSNKSYDAIEQVVGAERSHLFFIAGHVFTLNPNLKFKPSTFVKLVSGSPLIADISGNFLFHDKLNLGVSYRWSDSVSALMGLQLSRSLEVGYAYDYTTTNLGNYNSGSHEVFLRYQLFTVTKKLRSPRFF